MRLKILDESFLLELFFDLTNQYTYDFPFSNLSDSSFLKLRVVSKSSSNPASFNLSLFGQNRTIAINGSGSSYLSDAGRAAVVEYPFVNNLNSNYQFIKSLLPNMLSNKYGKIIA